MSHYVYILQNKINLKIYVGYSKNPQERWKGEKRTAFTPKDNKYNNPLYCSIRKHGWENFDKQIIEEWETKEEALEAEKFWIEFFRSNIKKYGKDYGYNLHEGGGLPPNHTGKIMSEETKRKIGLANKGRSPANKGKPSPRKGKKNNLVWTEEQKQQISAKLMGHSVSKETRNKISEANKGNGLGVPRSKETKQKISQASIGKKMSPESKLKFKENAM